MGAVSPGSVERVAGAAARAVDLLLGLAPDTDRGIAGKPDDVAGVRHGDCVAG
ncbi:MAG TPA: hypothetical protein VJU82_06485 [Acidobacteriaceae bacterium]|nr:hypothetical protein [Acidobacteriaceae bacterium]